MQYGRWGRQGMVWLAVLAAGTVHAAGEEAQISARFQQAVPEITVRGFAADTVRDVDLDGLPVRFHTQSGKVSSYWPFEVVYNDR